MFVDTSAIVAILTEEPEADELALRLSKASRRYTSPVVRLEASVVLATRLDIAPTAAQSLFDDFVQTADVSVVHLSDSIGRLAVEAFESFGKGRHPARLNIADCLSYACAKSYRVPLLYKGSDFSQTDIDDNIRG